MHHTFVPSMDALSRRPAILVLLSFLGIFTGTVHTAPGAAAAPSELQVSSSATRGVGAVSSTQPPTEVTSTSARLACTVNTDGKRTDVRVMWGAGSTIGTYEPWATLEASADSQTYTFELTGLDPDGAYITNCAARRTGTTTRYYGGRVAFRTMGGAPPPPPPPASSNWPSGVHIGQFNANQALLDQRMRQVDEFAAWRGREVTHILTWYAGGRANATWESIEGGRWTTGRVASLPQSVKDKFVVTAYPLPASGATMRQGAAGAYNAHWAALARNLVKAGMGKVALRWGHEFSGDWYTWSLAHCTPAEYAAYWRHVHTTMRANGFTGPFVLSPTGNGRHYDWTEAYPGDAYVDILAPDSYDGGTNNLTDPRGLRFDARFARDHGLQFGVTEWGLRRNGDNVSYIDAMHDLFADNADILAYEMYFNVIEHYLGPSSTAFPRAAQQYRDLWRA